MIRIYQRPKGRIRVRICASVERSTSDTLEMALRTYFKIARAAAASRLPGSSRRAAA